MLKQMKNTLFKKKTFSILYHEPKKEENLL